MTPQPSLAVSVFIPAYNYGRFLARAIDSALAQTLKPVEILVADDGSTDDTAQVAAAYGGRIRYERFEHAGVVAVRNAALAGLRGDWILNLDADDWIEPPFLEKAAALVSARGNPANLAFVYADRADFGAYERLVVSPEFDSALLKKKNHVPFDALFRRDVAGRFGFDPAFRDGWEDYDFWITLVKNGFVGVRLPGVPVHCRVHPASRTEKTFAADAMQRLMKQIVAKHADFFSPAEAEAAVRYFAPEAVLRHRICEFIRAKRYGRALAQLANTALIHPGALFSPTALQRVWAYLHSGRD